MKNLIASILFIFLLTQCNSINSVKGNGDRTEIVQDLDDFSQCVFEGGYKVTLHESRNSKLVMELDENLVQYITIEERGDELRIKSEKTLRSDDGILIDLYFSDLDKIEWNGAGELKTDDMIEVDDLTIYMSGAGAIDLDVEADNLDIRMAGAGDIELNGVSSFLEVDISGAGSLKGYDLQTEDAQIVINGVGSAEVNVNGSLEAEINGLGNINYKGEPRNVDRNVSGLGKISDKSS